MSFPQPTRAGHTFLGYRGVSNRHFLTDDRNKIKYVLPPQEIAGAAQLGAGVYVTCDVRMALDYALDSAWNYYCSKFKGKNVDDDAARGAFEQEQWKQWGQVHAVFVPTSKYESEKHQFPDFTQVNIDRMGEHVARNMMDCVARSKKPTWALKTQLFDKTQSVIYPPHTGALLVDNISDAVWSWHNS